MSTQTIDAVARYEGTVGTIEPLTTQMEDVLGDRVPPETRRLGRCWSLNQADFFEVVAQLEDEGYEIELRNTGGTY